MDELTALVARLITRPVQETLASLDRQPLSGAARIARLRRRRAAQGLVELRGVWVDPATAQAIRRMVREGERV